jgi:ferredoxin
MPDYVEHTIGDLTVRIEKNTCISTGNCIKLAPDVFEFDEKQIVAFTDGPEKAELSEADRDRIIEACSLCPVDALKVFDADGNQLVP